MSGRVLVTGAGGLVGRAVLAELLDRGVPVLATDTGTGAHRRLADELSARTGFAAAWADLTDPDAVAGLLAEGSPAAVIHLAAVIPPACYAAPAAARRVSVEGTRHLVRAASAQAVAPRLVHASSIAVHGARNPYAHADLLTARTPLAPTDLYGSHKAAAEAVVRASPLEWTVLRLGGVLSPEPSTSAGADMTWFEALLPTDGRLQTVDVRDVARACANAVSAPVAGETLMIGGDRSHRLRQGEVGPALTAAMGMPGALPPGRPGDPADDSAWYATDWMDTERAQEVLDFQRISWPQLLAEVEERTGRRRHLLRLAAPVLHEVLRRRSPYRHTPGPFADPMGAIRARWGEPGPDPEL